MNSFRSPVSISSYKAPGGVALFTLLIAIFLSTFHTGCGTKEEAPMEKPKPWFRVIHDKSISSQPVVVLERGGAKPMLAKIAPHAGANLFSLAYEGKELLYCPETNSLAGFTGTSSGTPVLYPTPNRVAGGKFTFEGRTFDFGLNDGDRFLHALVRDVAWEYGVPFASDSSASVTCWIDFAPGTELYGKFGFDHRLSLLYELDEKGLRISYKVENRDSRQLPYGIALHPYFNFLGERESAILCVPAQWHMEAVNLMPTGKLEKLDGAAFDIRQPTPVPNLVLDDVYFGMRSENPAWIEYRQAGIRLQLAASEEFTHMVVYIQPQNPFFCVENQTCSTDAHNLYARGLVEESNLLIVPAGEVREGWVHYIIEPLD
jgi:aldose 1-epimerase